MPEISAEMRQALYQEIHQDAQRIIERCQRREMLVPTQAAIEEPLQLEQLTYITEQIRLKLKMLGAPRIWN